MFRTIARKLCVATLPRFGAAFGKQPGLSGIVGTSMEQVLYEARYRGFFKALINWISPVLFVYLSWAYVASWEELELRYRIATPFLIASCVLGFLDVNVQYTRFMSDRVIHRSLLGKVHEYRYEEIAAFSEKFNGVRLLMRAGQRIWIGRIMGDSDVIRQILQERTSLMLQPTSQETRGD